MAYTLTASGLTLATKWRWVQFGEWIYGQNGEDAPIKAKWDAVTQTFTVLNWGQAAPTWTALSTSLGDQSAGVTYSDGFANVAINSQGKIAVEMYNSNTIPDSVVAGYPAGSPGTVKVYGSFPAAATKNISSIALGTTFVLGYAADTTGVTQGSGFSYELFAYPTAGIYLGLTDTVEYALTWRDSTYGLETNPVYGSTSGSLVVSGRINRQWINVGFTNGTSVFTCGDATFDKVVLYRNFNDGDFYEVAEYDTNAVPLRDTSSYASIAVPGGLLETDHYPPPIAYVPAVWDGRVWLLRVKSDLFLLVYSLHDQPEYFPTNNALRVYAEHGKPIAACPFGDQLVILTERKALSIRAGTTTYLMEEIPGSAGTVGPDAWAVVNEPDTGRILVWLTQNGVMKYNGAEAMNISDAIAPWFNDAGGERIIDPAALSSAFSEIDHTNEVLKFSLKSTTAGDDNDMEIVWDFGRAGTPWMRDIGVEKCAYASAQTRDCGDLRYFTDPHGAVWKESDTVFAEIAQNSGTKAGTVNTLSATTMGDTTGSFTTASDGQQGTWVRIRNSAGTIIRGRVTSNTATQLVVGAWTGGTPVVGDHYELGAIEYRLRTQDINQSESGVMKWRLGLVSLQTDNASSAKYVLIKTYLDRATTHTTVQTIPKNGSVFNVLPRCTARQIAVEIVEANTDEDFRVTALRIGGTPTGRAQ